MNTPPPSVQEALGTAGCPAEIHHGPRVYKVGHPDQRAKARLEQLVAQHARREVLELGGTAAEWLDRVEQGAYRTRGPGWLHVVQSPAGAVLFLLSLMREHHPDMTADEVTAVASAEPEQVKAALGVVAGPFFELVLADLSPDQRAAAVAEAMRTFTSAT
jgi:hypothetical protein